MRSITFDFFATYEIALLAGRTFDASYGTDVIPPNQPPQNINVIINEAAAEQFGYTPEEIIGKAVTANGASGVIVGVVENVYWHSVRNAIGPVVYVVEDVLESATVGGRFKTIRNAALRISGNNIPETLAYIDSVWAEFLPNQPVTRRFLNQDIDALYAGEERQGRMFFWFSALAIFIACLGLFGLSWYATEQRSKEIGVRKVMGGSNWDIVQLFTREFSKYVLAANIIAWPVTYWFMNRWLENFAYRIDLGFMPFISSAFLALLIAWLTVGAVAARAAGTRPVRVLRYE
jgi:putative ABC transport system permease protein